MSLGITGFLGVSGFPAYSKIKKLGNDSILGGHASGTGDANGDDTIAGGTGADSMIGGNGDDSISHNFFNGADGNEGDRIWGNFEDETKDLGDEYFDGGQGDYQDFDEL